MTKNLIAGHGQYSHPVPTADGLVVTILDSAHQGTAVWRDERRNGYCFADHERRKVEYAAACVLIRGLEHDEVEDLSPYGCDLDTPDGLYLVGIDQNDDLAWLTEGAEVLWDSRAVRP